MTPQPVHLPEFKDWFVSHEGKSPGAAGIYARQLSRCAKFYGIRIDEQTVRVDSDVQRIIEHVSKVVAKRGRWTKGTLNEHDITDNLIPALRAYARFAQDKFPLTRGGKRSGVTEARRSRGPQKQARSTEVTLEAAAVDVPANGIPKRMLAEISRLVRNGGLVQQIKAVHGHRCQVCGTTLELRPGIFYSEGHHLKPLGTPHNGPDVKENIISVCPNCHVRLDFAAAKIDRGTLLLVQGHSIRDEFIDYHNRLCDSAGKQAQR